MLKLQDDMPFSARSECVIHDLQELLNYLKIAKIWSSSVIV